MRFSSRLLSSPRQGPSRPKAQTTSKKWSPNETEFTRSHLASLSLTARPRPRSRGGLPPGGLWAASRGRSRHARSCAAPATAMRPAASTRSSLGVESCAAVDRMGSVRRVPSRKKHMFWKKEGHRSRLSVEKIKLPPGLHPRLLLQLRGRRRHGPGGARTVPVARARGARRAAERCPFGGAQRAHSSLPHRQRLEARCSEALVRRAQNVRGSHLPNTTCLTQVFFNSCESCCNID